MRAGSPIAKPRKSVAVAAAVAAASSASSGPRRYQRSPAKTTMKLAR